MLRNSAPNCGFQEGSRPRIDTTEAYMTDAPRLCDTRADLVGFELSDWATNCATEVLDGAIART
jgi:hypothetical protein